MEKAIGLTNLRVKYDDFTAVNDISFEMSTGEIFAIIGPNGSGKTSMIECIEGLRRPHSGEISVFGMNPQTHRQEIYKKMGVQLQNVQYPSQVKVSELCMLFSSFYEAPADWRVLLRQLGLHEKEKRYVQKLSGGEKQRLSILLALLPKPRLLILDELTTGLDPEVRRSIWDSLRVIRSTGTGVLLVSHYMEEVTAVADKVLFLLNGKAIYTGSLDGLKKYAQSVVQPEKWRDDVSLEDIYLLLCPNKDVISLEALQ